MVDNKHDDGKDTKSKVNGLFTVTRMVSSLELFLFPVTSAVPKFLDLTFPHLSTYCELGFSHSNTGLYTQNTHVFSGYNWISSYDEILGPYLKKTENILNIYVLCVYLNLRVLF